MLIPFSKILEKYNCKITGILHIGAHNCEELVDYQKYGFTNDKIIWIEANPELVKNNINIDNTRIIKNFICSDTDIGSTKLNIANNTQSSSILEFGSHASSYPRIKYVRSINVQNKRIDTMYLEDNIPNNFANFVNIDIQGAELLALKGMGNILHNFDYVYLEVNKAQVYKNCALVNEIDDYLSKFSLKRVETKWSRKKWGDALYIKVNNNFNIIPNARCTKELWSVGNITFKEALDLANKDPNVSALHWYKKKGGDGRLNNIKGWYQGSSGNIGTIKNNDWDTIIIK